MSIKTYNQTDGNLNYRKHKNNSKSECYFCYITVVKQRPISKQTTIKSHQKFMSTPKTFYTYSDSANNV